MEKSQMNKDELRKRNLFVDSLSSAGWRGSVHNDNFDKGLYCSPEASMGYSNKEIDLNCEFYSENPRIILYITSNEGKTLDLAFKCEDKLESLLDAIISMQDTIAPRNLKEKAEELLAVCPKMFTISASGDKLIPIKSKK